MFAASFQARGQLKDIGFGEALDSGDGGHGRTPFGQSSGLVDDDGVDFLHLLQRAGFADQNAGARAAADPDHH